MTIRNRLIVCLTAASLCFGRSMLVEWNYCVDGNARGVPMAVIHPGHGPVPYQFDLEGADGFGMVFDAVSVIVNLILYSLFPGLAVAALSPVALRAIRRLKLRRQQ